MKPGVVNATQKTQEKVQNLWKRLLQTNFSCSQRIYCLSSYYKNSKINYSTLD
jgi:hypothetical protein